ADNHGYVGSLSIGFKCNVYRGVGSANDNNTLQIIGVGLVIIVLYFREFLTRNIEQERKVIKAEGENHRAAKVFSLGGFYFKETLILTHRFDALIKLDVEFPRRAHATIVFQSLEAVRFRLM